MREMTRFSALLLCAALLGGCTYFREASGLTKKSPDEFAVSTKAPLVIPPDFNLRPPTPGAAPLNSTDPATSAQTALFGAADPATVAASLQGNYSNGERMLLANAGVQRANPAIRQQLQADRGSRQAADASFTARLMGTPASPNNSAPINADAELERRRGASAPAPAAPAAKSSGGWFDWF
jgi:hypothetical protein